MKSISIIIFSLVTIVVQAQTVEVQGELKVTTVNQNNAATDVLVRNTNGTVAKRDVGSIGGVPSTGIVLSETETNTILLNSGFTNVGYTNLSFFQKATGNQQYGAWAGTTANIAQNHGYRQYHTAEWTGSEMLIFGGRDFFSNFTNIGLRYHLANNTMQTTSISNAPSGREFHTSVWTGSKMIVWGGVDGVGTTNTGGIYDPITDAWISTSTINIQARSDHTSVWTGTEMITWGGIDENGNFTNTGNKYNPATDTWTSISTTNAPTPRYGHSAVWTGTEMIIWGGSNSSSCFNTGAKYNPLTNTWTTISTTYAPSGRYSHTCVWSPTLGMIVYGGYTCPSNTILDSGARYNPSTNAWTSMPVGPSGSTLTMDPVLVGARIIYWVSGKLYSFEVPSSPIGKWTALSNLNGPSSKVSFTSILAGTKMVVWGGSDPYVSNLGYIYDTSLPGYAPPN